MTWQIQTAKAKLSELITKAQTEGVQSITKNNKEVAYIINADEYKRLTSRSGSLVDFFRSSPICGEIELERSKDTSLREFKI